MFFELRLKEVYLGISVVNRIYSRYVSNLLGIVIYDCLFQLTLMSSVKP